MELALAEARAAAAEGEVCTVANDNDPSQVVISGHKGAIDRAIEIARDMGAKRAVLLPVSAPFHCSLMEPAAEAMRDALSYVVVEAPAVPLYANVTAQPETDPDTIRLRPARPPARPLHTGTAEDQRGGVQPQQPRYGKWTPIPVCVLHAHPIGGNEQPK